MLLTAAKHGESTGYTLQILFFFGADLEFDRGQ